MRFGVRVRVLVRVRVGDLEGVRVLLRVGVLDFVGAVPLVAVRVGVVRCVGVLVRVTVFVPIAVCFGVPGERLSPCSSKWRLMNESV